MCFEGVVRPFQVKSVYGCDLIFFQELKDVDFGLDGRNIASVKVHSIPQELNNHVSLTRRKVKFTVFTAVVFVFPVKSVLFRNRVKE